MVAKKLQNCIHPDVATLLAVLSSICGFMLYMQAVDTPASYLYACIPIVAHYIFDGIDGKIAKLRKMNRKNGSIIDKVSDGVSSIFFISGFFYAITKSVSVVALYLGLFSMVYVGYLHCSLSKHVEIKIGGTESRIVLIALNVIIWIQRSVM